MTSTLTDPIRWPAEALWEALAPALPGFTVEVLPTVDSSNSELMRRFRGSSGVEARPEPLLLVAEHQSAGRGRLGRHWQSQRGDSLTFSLGLPLHPADWSGLSLVVGISVAESLDPFIASSSRLKDQPFTPRISLKWPNDLWVSTAQGDRKLGGILVETAALGNESFVVIGIGLNIKALELSQTAPAAGTAPAAPLAIPTATPVAAGALQDLFPDLDAPEALLRILPALIRNVQAFEQSGFAPFQARFALRDVLSNRNVQLSGGTSLAEGIARGVGKNGALLVETTAGMKEITSAEVSVRPVQTHLSASATRADHRPC